MDYLGDVCMRGVACGSGHTVVLDGDGVVYTWGRGDDGISTALFVSFRAPSTSSTNTTEFRKSSCLPLRE